MAEANVSVTESRREKAIGREAIAADEIAILDHVMLDFIDEPFTTWKNDRRGATQELWRRA